MFYTFIAQEIARERIREADRVRLARELQGGRSFSGSPRLPGGPSQLRALIARPIRLVSDASHAFSEVACIAATRIEGRAS